MTFDELLNDLETFKKQAGYKYHEDPNSALDMGFKLNEIEKSVKKLRETYAPTIEMTKDEYEIFKSAKVDEDSAEWLDDVEWGRVDYDYPKFFQAWLHPETIKVVDSND
jgi:hypothetical protein